MVLQPEVEEAAAAVGGAVEEEEAGGQEEDPATRNHHRHTHQHLNLTRTLQLNHHRGVPASGQVSASAVSLQQLLLPVADKAAMHRHHHHKRTFTIKITATEAGMVSEQRVLRPLADRQGLLVVAEVEDGTMTIEAAQWEG